MKSPASRRSGCGPIDSHCHLQSLEREECARALDAARSAGVEGFLVPAIRLEDCERLLELCQREDDVWCALGVHPHEAGKVDSGWDTRLFELLDEPKVVAVGECGLDFHYDFAPREVQLQVMERQWEIALDARLPVIVHNRDSNDAMRAILGQPAVAALRGVFHSFAGGSQFADELCSRGFWIGVSGMVTFPKAENVRQGIRAAASDRLLVETDTPYLAPVPYRGKPNQPAFVVEVARGLAELMDVTYEAVCAQTSKNFRALFQQVTENS